MGSRAHFDVDVENVLSAEKKRKREARALGWSARALAC